MKFNIKHISLRSAFKVGCLMHAAIFLCLIVSMIGTLAGSALGLLHNTSIATLTGAIGLAVLPAFVGYALVGGIIPAVFFSFFALIYNVVAFHFGGLVLTLERRGGPAPEIEPEKQKRKSIDEIEQQIKARRAKMAP